VVVAGPFDVQLEGGQIWKGTFPLWLLELLAPDVEHDPLDLRTLYYADVQGTYRWVAHTLAGLRFSEPWATWIVDYLFEPIYVGPAQDWGPV